MKSNGHVTWMALCIKIRPTLSRWNGTVLIHYAGSDYVSEAWHEDDPGRNKEHNETYESARSETAENNQMYRSWEKTSCAFVKFVMSGQLC